MSYVNGTPAKKRHFVFRSKNPILWLQFCVLMCTASFYPEKVFVFLSIFIFSLYVLTRVASINIEKKTTAVLCWAASLNRLTMTYFDFFYYVFTNYDAFKKYGFLQMILIDAMKR